MTEDDYFNKAHKEIVPDVLRHPMEKHQTLITLWCAFLVFVLCAILILSPMGFAYLWYCLVHDPISSAIIGIVCGAIFDYFVILFVS